MCFFPPMNFIPVASGSPVDPSGFSDPSGRLPGSAGADPISLF